MSKVGKISNGNFFYFSWAGQTLELAKINYGRLGDIDQIKELGTKQVKLYIFIQGLIYLE